ncbi:unnamed protein product [Lathyrus sativus]|nr:unnamed protein product [Lathyrus sativus]
MEEILCLKIHHSGEFVDSEKTNYVGDKCNDLEIDVDMWSYFELVDVLKDLGYTEVDTIYYNYPTFGINVLKDDKGALEVADLCRVHLKVDIYIEHSLSQPEYVENPINMMEEKAIDEEPLNMVNPEVESILQYFYEEVIKDTEVGTNGESVNNNGVKDMNVGEGVNNNGVEGTNVGVNNNSVEGMNVGECVNNNGVEGMNIGESVNNDGEVHDVMDTNAGLLNEIKSSEDSEDESYNYDSALEVTFSDSGMSVDYSEEHLDNLVEYDGSHEETSKKKKKKWE